MDVWTNEGVKRESGGVVVSPGQFFTVVLNLWSSEAAQNVHQGNWNNPFSIIYTHGMGDRCENNLKQHPRFEDTAPLGGYIMKKVLEATEVEINTILSLV